MLAAFLHSAADRTTKLLMPFSRGIVGELPGYFEGFDVLASQEGRPVRAAASYISAGGCGRPRSRAVCSVRHLECGHIVHG
jgi:hypothetical protein